MSFWNESLDPIRWVVPNVLGNSQDYDPRIVLFHPYFPFYQNLNLVNQMPYIENRINTSWDGNHSGGPFNFQFDVEEIDVGSLSILPTDGTVQLYYLTVLNEPQGIVYPDDLQKIWNRHLCRTINLLFEICPRARIRVLYHSTIRFRGVNYQPSDLIEAINFNLSDTFYFDNNFIFVNNCSYLSAVPPLPDINFLYRNITIPLFYSVPNYGWIINNYIRNYLYAESMFISNKICKVGMFNSDDSYNTSSGGFLNPSTIPIRSDPELLVNIIPGDVGSFQTVFFRYCRYALVYDLFEWEIPTYQNEFKINLPQEYMNQILVPDVSDFGWYILYTSPQVPNDYAKGPSFSVIMFGASYALIRMVSQGNFIINSSAANSFISQMYNFQFNNPGPDDLLLFQYVDEEDICQKIYFFPPPVLVPADINCWQFYEYVISEPPNPLKGLNPMGLGRPLWTNWNMNNPPPG